MYYVHVSQSVKSCTFTSRDILKKTKKKCLIFRGKAFGVKIDLAIGIYI